MMDDLRTRAQLVDFDHAGAIGTVVTRAEIAEAAAGTEFPAALLLDLERIGDQATAMVAVDWDQETLEQLLASTEDQEIGLWFDEGELAMAFDEVEGHGLRQRAAVLTLAVAAAGYVVRYLGGDWGRTLQIELLFAALVGGVLVVSSGRLREPRERCSRTSSCLRPPSLRAATAARCRRARSPASLQADCFSSRPPGSASRASARRPCSPPETCTSSKLRSASSWGASAFRV